jgi:DNA invertase Pin-like site-specific DNA recombinase
MGVYTYARYSTDRQTEASIVDQQRRCHDYAKFRDLSVDADFSDQGISGAALGNRPGFQAVLATLKPGDTLLAADLTRLSRSQELAPLLDRLRFRGIRVIGVLDGFDSDSPQARMQAGLSGLMSDELRAGIRSRTHSALQMRAAMGRPTGGKVFGFDAAGEVMPQQAAVVLEIFTRFSLGETMKSIVRDLNFRRIPSPGATWKRTDRRRDGCWLLADFYPAPDAPERAVYRPGCVEQDDLAEGSRFRAQAPQGTARYRLGSHCLHALGRAGNLGRCPTAVQGAGQQWESVGAPATLSSVRIADLRALRRAAGSHFQAAALRVWDLSLRWCRGLSGERYRQA